VVPFVATALQDEFMDEWHRLAPRVKGLRGVIDLSMSKTMKDNTIFAVYAVFDDMHSLHQATRCACK
jgi:heme-degrading monooxygenase HmoA